MIRAARPDEWPELTRLAHAAKASWGYAAADLAAWRDDLRFSAASIREQPTFVVDDRGAVRAVLQLDTRAQPWEIGALWVDPGAMRQGHGRALMRHAAAYALGRGQHVVAIDADPNAAAFYRALGAHPVGEVPAPVVGDLLRVRPQLMLPLAAAAANGREPELQMLSRARVSELQELYDACVDYFVHAQGQAAPADAALAEFDDRPDGVPAEAKVVFGSLQPDGSCAAMVEGLRDYPQAGVWYLGLMLVRPALRSQGLGAALVRRFEHLARAAGAREIRLCVFDTAPRSRAFWERNGYRVFRAVPATQFGAKRHARTELHKMLDGS
ncbi:GNAT family N-acetyltransferase [Comamonadaceae bacterium G21597-S1]|nr:GNAT family N-acetyltransferase [Comamonadaceae bacterium G21597-S1]